MLKNDTVDSVYEKVDTVKSFSKSKSTHMHIQNGKKENISSEFQYATH